MKDLLMKRKVIALITVVAVIFAALFVIKKNIEGTTNHITSKKGSLFSNANKTDDSCCVELSRGKLSDLSIYQLKSTWKNQESENVRLQDFLGKKVILAMIYTNCPTACPAIVGEMLRLQSAIPKSNLSDYRFVLVSVDPKRDAPSQLEKYAKERNLNEKLWTLLTGSNYQISELAQMIGFKYMKKQNDTFLHSNLITFIDEKGEIKNQSEGLNQNINTLLSMSGN